MEQFKSIQQEITDKLVSGLQNRLEELFIEGLKLKGFEFNSKKEIEDFVSIRCRCEDNIHYKEKVYFVDNTPFLLHKYETEFSMPTEENNGVKISANYGSYKFL